MSTTSLPAAPAARAQRLFGALPTHLGRMGRGLRFALMAMVCLLGSLLAVGTALIRFTEASTTGELSNIQNTLVVMAFLGAMAAVVVLRRRHTTPYAVTLVTAALPLALPLDATAALFALAALVRSRTGHLVWVCAGAVGVATLAALLRDARGATTESSVLKMMTSSGPAGRPIAVDLSLWVPFLVALVLMAASVGTGLLMRSRQDLALTTGRAVAAAQSTARLTDELGRQAERDLIAREVHDVIGHRLSLLSLHAGGLEVAAGHDPRLAQSAALVRSSAQQAMDDLRSLLRVLREPGQQMTATAMPSLGDLPEVIEETVDSGMPVISTVYLTQPEQADAALARAVYRIVQELLTNARRHAPGAPVRLVVRGGPAEGIRIETVNRLTTQKPGAPGNGLTGISERAVLFGGTMQAGLDEGSAFRVAVWLPWSTAALPEAVGGVLT